MDIEQMQKALEEREAAIARFEVYEALHKAISKHVRKLQSRMRIIIDTALADKTASEYVHALLLRTQNDAQQKACIEILDILLLKMNESAEAFEKWNKTHSKSNGVS